MVTILRYTFSRFTGQVLGWGISLALLGAYGVLLHDSFVKPESQQQYMQLVSGYPPEMMAFFGDMSDIFSPSGYLNLIFFSYIPIVTGIFTISSGAALLAGEEAKGTLDLVLAHPISRSRLFWGRLAALTLAIIAILLLTWVGFVVPLNSASLDASPMQIFQALLSLFGTLMFFGTLALLLSMLLPSGRLAAMISGGLLVVSYFFTSLGRVNEELRDIEQLMPLHYYQGGYAVADMNWGWAAVLLGSSVLFALLGCWRFERRDVRVAGEGNWGLMSMFSRKKDKISRR